MKEAKKQPKKVKRPLSGLNQWRESTKGSTYLKRLFVEGEAEKERRCAKFEERLSSFGVAQGERREKQKGAQHIDLSAAGTLAYDRRFFMCVLTTLLYRPATPEGTITCIHAVLSPATTVLQQPRLYLPQLSR